MTDQAAHEARLMRTELVNPEYAHDRAERQVMSTQEAQEYVACFKQALADLAAERALAEQMREALRDEIEMEDQARTWIDHALAALPADDFEGSIRGHLDAAQQDLTVSDATRALAAASPVERTDGAA